MVYENRAQHAALLESATTDASERIASELTRRANDLARHIADRVAVPMLTGDAERVGNEMEVFLRVDTVLGVVLRATGGNEIFARRREAGAGDAITRSTIAPVRTQI